MAGLNRKRRLEKNQALWNDILALTDDSCRNSNETTTIENIYKIN